METVKVRQLSEPVFNKVKDIQPGKSGYNLYLQIITKTVLIDIKRIDQSRVVICDFLVGDETGVIKMRLRNENYIDMLQEGQDIIVRNCKVPVINSRIRIQVDAFGKIELSQDVKIKEVNKERNLSEDVFDHFSSKTRRFVPGKNKKPNPVSETNSEQTFLSSSITGTVGAVAPLNKQ
jgi:hypothetical protein